MPTDTAAITTRQPHDNTQTSSVIHPKTEDRSMSKGWKGRWEGILIFVIVLIMGVSGVGGFAAAREALGPEEAKIQFDPGSVPGIIYPGQDALKIWPEFKNKGPDKIDEVRWSASLPDGLVVTNVYGGPCHDSVPTPFVCAWKDVGKGDDGWMVVTLKVADDLAVGRKVSIPITLTSFVGGRKTSQVRHTYTWDVKQAPTYRQVNPKDFPQPRERKFFALPDAEVERERLAQWSLWADFQSTGFYLNPRTDLTVTASGLSGDPDDSRLELLIGSPALVNPEDEEKEEVPTQLRSKPLTSGANVVSDFYGGVIYVRYSKKSQHELPEITVKIGSEAEPFPFYEQGVTTGVQWKQMLEDSKVPFAEHSARHVSITGLAAYAKKYADEDQEELLSIYQQIIDAQNSISGLDGKEPTDEPSTLRPMVVQTPNAENPNATNYRAAMPGDSMEGVYKPASLRHSWGMWHEFGHHRQHDHHWSWDAMSEVTVNIYSLAARRLFPEESVEHGTPDEWKEAKEFLALPLGERNFDENAGHFTRLAMFEQLRLLFGDDLFHRLHKESRRLPELPSDGEKKRYFMVTVSRLSQTDLTEYFKKWGLRPDVETVKQIANLNLQKPASDLTITPVFGGK
ncbi:M60 family metallopeptidase [Streptomyces albireticuli]|nr:M60 family metallopeptidase [Streptomyces albireticuli]